MNGGHVADSRSAVVQPCARCGARWAVQGKPLHWCPRCHGVLLSPAPVDAPANRRNYRWVARPPGRKSGPAQPHRPASSRETPHYRQIPRWGLLDRPPLESATARRPLARFTDRLSTLLIATAIAFGVAALAELGRYGVLLRNRTRLIPPWLLWISDAAVTVSAVVALVLALCAAIALVGWLAETRRAVFASAGREDSRSLMVLVLLCVYPVLNLVWPGVFLIETVRVRDAADPENADPRLLRAVRIWWAAWILNGVMVAVSLLFRFASTLQVQADGVLFTLWTNLVAAGVAIASLGLVRAFAGLDLRGRPKRLSRWVIATTPVRSVIEPVRPGGGVDRPAASTERALAVAVGDDEAQAQQQEVVAK